MKILKQKNIFSNKILLISLLLIAILFCQVCLGGNKKRNGKSINSEVNFQHKSERQSLSQSDSIKIDGKKKELEQLKEEQNLNKLNNEEEGEEVKKKENFEEIEENTSNFGKEKIKNKSRKRGKGKKKGIKNQENSKQINTEKVEGITDEIFKNVEEEIWNDYNENFENKMKKTNIDNKEENKIEDNNEVWHEVNRKKSKKSKKNKIQKTEGKKLIQKYVPKNQIKKENAKVEEVPYHFYYAIDLTQPGILGKHPSEIDKSVGNKEGGGEEEENNNKLKEEANKPINEDIIFEKKDEKVKKSWADEVSDEDKEKDY